MAGKNKPKKGTSKPSPYPLPRRSARRVSIESRAVTTENQDHGVVDAPMAEEAMTDQPMPIDNRTFMTVLDNLKIRRTSLHVPKELYLQVTNLNQLTLLQGRNLMISKVCCYH